ISASVEIEVPAERRPVVADVLEQLGERGDKGEVVLLDALDEADDPYQIADFIRQLAQQRRVLLGTRRNIGRGSGRDPNDLGPLLKMLQADPPDVIHLDLVQEAQADIEDYVRRRLTDPAVDCAYRWDDVATSAAAIAIGEQAKGVFRLAVDWCRLLCR